MTIVSNIPLASYDVKTETQSGQLIQSVNIFNGIGPQVSYDSVTGAPDLETPTTIVYKLGLVTVATLTLTYDTGKLVSVVRT